MPRKKRRIMELNEKNYESQRLKTKTTTISWRYDTSIYSCSDRHKKRKLGASETNERERMSRGRQ